MYPNIIKRLLDFITALVIILVAGPIIIIVWIGLVYTNSGSAFFYQTRPGKNEKLFQIIKFKTMNDKKDDNGLLLPDAERLTTLGKFVRRTSLDELPQLINVLRGEMSLVGPRPLLPEYLPLYTKEQAKRHQVRPGITGLAQVRGRNQVLFSERLKNDQFYVEHISFGLDMNILLLTVKQVLFKSKDVVHGQTVDEVDDLGLSKNLDANHFKQKR